MFRDGGTILACILGELYSSMPGKWFTALSAAFCFAWWPSWCAEAADLPSKSILVRIDNAVLDQSTVIAPITTRRSRRVQYRMVLFVTNRHVNVEAIEKALGNDAQPLPSDEVFEEKISSGIAYGWAEISYPSNRKRGDTTYNQDVKNQNPYRDFTVADYDLFPSKEEFLGTVRKPAANIPKSSLVYVHGFNVSFEEAAERSAQMSMDIDRDALPIFFSWPSAHEYRSYYSEVLQLVENYETATNNSKQTRPYLGALPSTRT
jgi:hypothetical protein